MAAREGWGEGLEDDIHAGEEERGAASLQALGAADIAITVAFASTVAAIVFLVVLSGT